MYVEKNGKTYEINLKTLEVKELRFKGVCLKK